MRCRTALLIFTLCALAERGSMAGPVFPTVVSGAHPPLPHIISAVVNGRRLDVHVITHIRPTMETTSFEVQTENLWSPSGPLHYQYRLTNYVGGWADGGAGMSGTYGNVGPGLHRFEVRHIGANGAPEPGVVSVSFYVEPRFYERPGFWGMLVGGVLVALAAMIAAVRSNLGHVSRRSESDRPK